jgi:hypothetical protein
MKNRSLLTIILAVAAVIGTVIAFLLAVDRNLVFWSSYIFSIIALAMIYISAVYLAESGSRYFPVHASFTTLSVLYLTADIIVIILFTNFVRVPALAYFSIHLAVFAVFVILGLLQMIANKAILADGEKKEIDTVNWRLLSSDLQSLISVSDDATRPLLTDLYEKVRYSDPMSNPVLFGMDRNIKGEIQDLISTLRANGSTGITKERISRITNMLNERNLKVKVLK